MLQQYTSADLQSFNRTQLWAICRERGLKCYPKTVDCVETVLTHQSSQIEKVQVAEVAPEQPKTCSTCPLFKPFNDGSGRGLCCGSDQVCRDHHPQTQDCLHMIEEQNRPAVKAETQPAVPAFNYVQSGELIFKPVGSAGAYEVWSGDIKYGVIRKLEDGQWLHGYASITTKYATPQEAAAALVETVKLRESRSQDIEVLENWGNKFVVRNKQNGCHYVVQPKQPNPHDRCECGDCHWRGVTCKHQIAVAPHVEVESLSEEIEVDSNSDPDFGLMYRVWWHWELLGTFYRALDGKWVAQPCESDARPRCETANQAQLLILATAGMLVAGEVSEEEYSFPETSREEEMAIA